MDVMKTFNVDVQSKISLALTHLVMILNVRKDHFAINSIHRAEMDVRHVSSVSPL